ncbi:hypothetical protein KCP73_11270 [Salmonella enterica subsp. enterica]|nr:hypothetical protein KCP73_11270 [Salmonella enterica subsp. enterica]
MFIGKKFVTSQACGGVLEALSPKILKSGGELSIADGRITAAIFVPQHFLTLTSFNFHAPIAAGLLIPEQRKNRLAVSELFAGKSPTCRCRRHVASERCLGS